MQLSMFLSATKQWRCLINSLLIITQPKFSVNCFSPNFHKFFDLFYKDFVACNLAQNSARIYAMICINTPQYHRIVAAITAKNCSIATKNALLSGMYSYYTTMKEKMSNNLQKQNIDILSVTTLDKIPIGESCVLVRCDLPAPLGNRLQEMGLTPDTEVTVLKTAPLGDPIEIRVRGYSLCLRKETLRKFFVVPTTTARKTSQ